MKNKTSEMQTGLETKSETMKQPQKRSKRYGKRRHERGVLFKKESHGKTKYLFFFTENGEIRRLLSNGFKVFFEEVSIGQSCIITSRSIDGGDWNLLVSIQRESCNLDWTKKSWKITLFCWICQIQETKREAEKRAFRLFETIVQSQEDYRLRTFVKTIFFILKKIGFKFIFNSCADCKRLDVPLFWALEVGGLICGSCRRERAPDNYPFLCSKQEQNDLEFIQNNDLETIYSKMDEKRVRSRIVFFLISFIKQNCGFYYSPFINNKFYSGTDGSTM